MPHARYYRTMFVSPLLGQHRIWKSEVVPLAKTVDEMFTLGNLVGLEERMHDPSPERSGPNGAILGMTQLWRATFDNYTSLIGPNEIVALNLPGTLVSMRGTAVLRDMWLSSDSGARFDVAAVSKGRLVTHGGLTYGEWVSLGRPDSATETAARLNEKYRGSLAPGPCHALDGLPNYAANPIFASPVLETLPSWLTTREDIPFSQVHSAGGVNTILGREALASEFSPLRTADTLRHMNFGSMVTIRDRIFYSIFIEFASREILRKFPEPWHFYLEKIPVVDTRDELLASALATPSPGDSS